MADDIAQRITALSPLDTPVPEDVLPVVDDPDGVGKKTKKTGFGKFLRTYNISSEESSLGLSNDDLDFKEDFGHVIRYGENTIPGTTDLAVAIQRASDVGRIIIPDEPCFTGSTITCDDNLIVIGENRSKSIIKMTDTAKSVFTLTGTFATRKKNVHFSNFTIQHGNVGAGTETGYPVFCQWANNVSLKNLNIRDGNQRGMLISKCVDVDIINNLLTNAGRGYTTVSGGEAIFVNTCQHVLIDGNRIKDSGRHAINYFRSYDVTCVNNKGIDIGHTLVTVSGNGDPATSKQTVTSLTRSGSTATATIADHLLLDEGFSRIVGAVETEYNGTFQITVVDKDTFTYTIIGTPTTPATGTITANDTSGQHGVISGNTGVNMARSGAIVENEAHHQNVTDNNFFDMHDYGVLVGAGHGDGPEFCSIIGNSIKKVRDPAVGTGDGIRASGAPSTSIGPNVVEDVERHLYRVNGLTSAGTVLTGVIGKLGDADGISLFTCLDVAVNGGNISDIGAHGMSVQDCTECSIDGIHVINPSTTGVSAHGIFINGSVLSSDNNTISNTHIEDTNVSPLMQDGINFEAGSVDNTGTNNRIINANRNPVRYAESQNFLSESYATRATTITATGNTTFVVADGILTYYDTNGANRNHNPAGFFPNDFEYTIINTGAETITFDSTGLAQAILTGKSGIFVFDGTNWHEVSIIPPDPEIVTTTNVITAGETGKTFYLNAVGGFTSTLPAPANGLKYKFIVKTAPTTAYIITTNASANVLFGTFIDIVGELTYFSAQDTLNFVASVSVVGDFLEVESDGTNWYCTAKSGADGGITVAVT